MKTQEQYIQEFNQLPFEKKKEIVFKMVEEIKDINEDTKYIHESLGALKNIDEELLSIIYENIVEVAEKVSQGIKVESIKNIDAMKQKIKEIQEKEAIERAQENPDPLLENL